MAVALTVARRPAGRARSRRPPPAGARAGHRSHAGRGRAGHDRSLVRGCTGQLAGCRHPRVPRAPRRATLWWALVGCLGAGVHQVWTQADNHQYLIIYWVLAVALAAGTIDPAGARAVAARWLLAAVFALATLWKLSNLAFVDGSFFEFTLLTDSRLSPGLLRRDPHGMRRGSPCGRRRERHARRRVAGGEWSSTRRRGAAVRCASRLADPPG